MPTGRTEPSRSISHGENIRARATTFATRVVNFCNDLHAAGGVARPMALQLVRCSTSVAAMLEKARAAESRRDFVSKCSICLKEAREALVRLRVCAQTQVGPADEAAALVKEADEIVAILMTIVRNARRNAGLLPVKSTESTNS
jgi:four helix bundle protein